MCYSAMVRQGVKKELRFDARLDYSLFEEIFRRRVTEDRIKIPKALEANFVEPENAAEKQIKNYIDQYHARKTKELEAELFKQKKRLADAERKLNIKETKKAIEDRRIATYKITWHLDKIADLKRTTLKPNDSRIFRSGTPRS